MSDTTSITPATEEIPEQVTEKWTCAGVRASKGKRYVAWIDGGGKELWYAARTARYALGATYSVEVSRRAEAGKVVTSRWNDPVFVAPGIADARVLEWRAKELAAESELALGRMERKAKLNDPLDELMLPLVQVAARLKNGAERRAFAAEVLRRIQRDAW